LKDKDGAVKTRSIKCGKQSFDFTMSEPKDGVKKTQAAKKWIKGVTQLSSYEKYEIKDMVDGGANV